MGRGRSIALTLGAGLALLTAAPGACADAANAGRPLAAVAHAGGRIALFWQGANGDLWETVGAGQHWGTPTDLGMGRLGSPPTATVGPDDSDVVLWQGADDGLWEATDAGGHWTGPTSVPGMGPLGSQPTATSWGTSAGNIEIDVSWQGSDRNLWEAWYESSTGAWRGPHSLGMGQLGSAPAATAQGEANGSSAEQVFWTGTQGDLWEGDTASGVGGAWSGPTDIGMGQLGSPPTVGWLPDGEEDVFWAGFANGQLWQARFSGGKWTGPTDVGIGPIASAPTVLPVWPSSFDVFWIGADGTIWQASESSGTWTSVNSVSPLTPPPPASPGPTTVLPTPPASAPHQAPALHVRIVMGWHYRGAHTRLAWARFRRIPVHGAITVLCSGGGCHGWRLRVSCSGRHCRWTGRAGRRRLAALVRALQRRPFHAGQRLIVIITAPGHEPEVGELIMRRGQKPLAELVL